MKRTLIRSGIFLVIAGLLVSGTWVVMYPGPSDPKNLRYVLWKHGLCEMDLDRAAGNMIGDGNRNSLVLGKTREQLRKQFGYLLSPDEVSPYLREFYSVSGWKRGDVSFIRTSPWMVVFKNGKADDLVLVKG
jgi:hypothetical protein